MATTWTDDPLSKSVPCKAQHINELRAAIEAVTGVTVIPWGRGNRVGTSSNIRAQDMVDLRNAIGPHGNAGSVWAVRNVDAGLMLWNESVPGTGPLGQVLRASHVVDLRRWFNTSETGASNYQFPQVRPLLFGINPSWKSTPGHYPDPYDDQMLTKIRAAGATCIRSGINWADVEPTQGGGRNFGLFDYQINLAVKYGLTWVADVGTAPGWATTGPNLQLPTQPQYESNFSSFVTDMATRYRGTIHHYEFNNEPDFSQSWNNPDPAKYVHFLQLFYNAVKGVDSSVWVSTGGVSNLHSDAGLPFISGIYANNGRPYFDAIAGHPYNPNSGPMDTAGIQNLRVSMINNNDPFKPIWITEYGWDLSTISPAQQQTNLQNALGFFSNPNNNYVTVATFQLIADVPGAMMGLIDQSLQSPRPAYGTFSSFAKPTT